MSLRKINIVDFEKIIHFSRNPIGAQFTPYPVLKTSILNWRNEILSPLPAPISEVAEAVESEMATRELTNEISYTDEETEAMSQQENELWK